MINDEMKVIKNGDTTALVEPITLQSGAEVSKDGTVKYANGKTTQLKNGQYISLNSASDKKSKSKKSKSEKESSKSSKSTSTHPGA
jgi:hypothetical protein